MTFVKNSINSAGDLLTIEYEFEDETGEEKVYWSLERDGESGMPVDPETGDDLEPTGVMNVTTKL